MKAFRSLSDQSILEMNRLFGDLDAWAENKLNDYECLVIDLQSFKPLEDSIFILRHDLV